MKLFWLTGFSVLVLTLGAISAPAQNVISAKSGLVHYVEGDVELGGQPLSGKFAQFAEVKENQVLSDEDGRAEVLLNPGVFLRLGEHASFRMITNRLIDTRVELLSGTAVVEADEIGKDTSVTVVCKGGVVKLRKAGVYRFDADPARLRVYSGEASVVIAGKTLEVGGGKALALEGDSTSIEKFDKEDLDSLGRWSRRRGEYVAMANVSAAKSLADSGASLATSIWQWNPWLGMMTFIPSRGMLYSPYGFSFWSPGMVDRVFYVAPPMPSFSGLDASARGYAGIPQTSSGYSGAVAAAGSSRSPSSGSTAAVAAPTASVGRGSAAGGGRQQ